MSKGLPSRFYLANGKFSLVEGTEKSRDSIWFYCIFDKFRVYRSDFGANFSALTQKPIAYLVLNKTLLLGSLKRGIQKYIPNVKVKNIDIGYVSKDRKTYSMMIEYSSVINGKEKIQDVTFI